MEHAPTVSLVAALVAGLAGSGHCFGMCGGIAVALGLRARPAAGGDAGNAAVHAILYHAGRLSSYATGGALAGGFGQLVWRVLDLGKAGALLRMSAGALLVFLAVGMLTGWRGATIFERLGGRIWGRIAPVAVRLARRGGTAEALLLGTLWGWLPCGLVYSMLLLAAASADITTGALVMLVFGAGTLPSMLGSSLLAGQMSGLLRQPAARRIAGVLLLLFGLWTFAGPLMHLAAVDHGYPVEHKHHRPSAIAPLLPVAEAFQTH